jgi:hypothetical protein
MRRRLRDKFGIPPTAEIKGSHFKVQKGVFRKIVLPIDQRMKLFRGLIKYQERFPISVFAIAIEKAAADARGHHDAQETAWLMALQRIHTFSKKAKDLAMIFPDEGHGFVIRRIMRRLRRHHTVPQFWGQGIIREPLTTIIEDPNERASHLSYFSQLADWNAYAAHRSQYISPAAPVPTDAWDQLGRVMLRAVNQNTGGPPGIVRWPRVTSPPRRAPSPKRP